MDIQSITPAQITKAYTGKIGCMCGCKGKYYVPTPHDYATVNPAMVTKILRTIQANEEKAEVDSAGGWVSYDAGGKRWCVYLAE